MVALYIILGFLCLMIAVFLLYKRNEMKNRKYHLNEQKQQIEVLNQQLDEIDEQLKQLEAPISKVNQISLKIFDYLK